MDFVCHEAPEILYVRILGITVDSGRSLIVSVGFVIHSMIEDWGASPESHIGPAWYSGMQM